jgi:hypothetical protein
MLTDKKTVKGKEKRRGVEERREKKRGTLVFFAEEKERRRRRRRGMYVIKLGVLVFYFGAFLPMVLPTDN